MYDLMPGSFRFFLVGYVEEKLWWPIQSPNIGTLLSNLLPVASWKFYSGDQGYHSRSSEAFQKHQKLDSLTPFASFTN